MSRPLAISFEIFPPRDGVLVGRLYDCIDALAHWQPEFVSVTYGAGGLRRTHTYATVEHVLTQTSLEVAAHLTCVGASRDETDSILQQYKSLGVKRLVLLRGDMPEGPGAPYKPHPQGYANAAELVARAKQMGGFEIMVASYPEQHPDSGSLQADMDNLKRKQDAGAQSAITQFFLDADLYFRHRDAVDAAGITLPIRPGIMLQPNFESLARMAQTCGTHVPDSLRRLFAGSEDDSSRRDRLSIEWNRSLIERLIAGGTESLHFYMLNRADIIQGVCSGLVAEPQKR